MRKVVGVVLALVLVALTIVTALRFLDTSVRWVVLMTSFSSYAALGFLLVLLGCLLAMRRPPRSRWLVISRTGCRCGSGSAELGARPVVRRW